MEQFSFEETSMNGLMLIHPFIHYDERGFFMKTYEQHLFEEHGIFLGNAEDLASSSQKGVLRGLHFQTRHAQDKLIRIVRGEVFDVAVDLRKDSKTYGKWEGFRLSEDNHLGLYIPSGFAHGFLALSENVLFTYRCGQPYEPGYDGGIRYDDPEIGVKWPLELVDHLILSEKDQKLPYLREVNVRL
ncbi:MAG: dTDP-4-dehydrorhamnose 3,5-epimerase [Lachnospiraceae bacterium]|nr:dTDP-4-dehydrorhamnose 3,5-epimerase [Lachnospiraceae bacterium]